MIHMIYLPRDFSRICMDFPGFHLFIIYFFGLLYRFYNALAICIDVDARSGVIVGVLCLKLPKAGLGKWLWSCTNHGKLLPFLIEILPISSNWAAGTTSNNLVEKLRSKLVQVLAFPVSQPPQVSTEYFSEQEPGVGIDVPVLGIRVTSPKQISVGDDLPNSWVM